MPDRSWIGPALLGVVLLTAFRIYAIRHGSADLFVDESQYWFWGQELAFGYYSKPPLIGWVIRASVELSGSDASFWVRLPAPLFHAATAMILGYIANTYLGRAAAIVTALGYISLPLVAVGSFLISTDTIMFPFLALALAFYLRAFDGGGGRWPLLAGAMLGAAFMAKYAAIYYVLCAALAAVAFPQYRPSWRQVGAILGMFLIVISPNLIWNAYNGFSTAQHTLDNANWVRDPTGRATLNIAGLAEFFAAQFLVFGPVLFALLLVAGWRAARGGLTLLQAALLYFSLPIIAIVCIQAILSEAYPNWAAAAYLAGSLVVLPLLLDRRVWLKVSFGINLALSLLVPLLVLNADRTRLMDRYTGIYEMSEEILAVAEAQNQTTVVASNRAILADLFYTGKGRGFEIAAVPPTGRAPHHYALKHPLRAGEGTVLAVLKRPPACDATPVATFAPDEGHYAGQSLTAFVIPRDCWAAN